MNPPLSTLAWGFFVKKDRQQNNYIYIHNYGGDINALGIQENSA